MSTIPIHARLLVTERARQRCERCGGRGGHWHHRRGRAVVDEHTHCPCNGVLLCKTCHDWAHAEPLGAMETGFVVSRYQSQPGLVQVKTPWGIRYHDCVGGMRYE